MVKKQRTTGQLETPVSHVQETLENQLFFS